MRKPELEGKHGKAWLSALGAEPPGLAAWLVNAPGRHPFWEHWMVSVIHLRKVNGIPSASKRYPAAEHELLVMAIDPTAAPMPSPDEAQPLMFPPDLVYQFDGVGDQKAIRLCEGYVREIVESGQTPDSDAQRWWTRTLDNVVRQLRANRRDLLWRPATSTERPRAV